MKASAVFSIFALLLILSSGCISSSDASDSPTGNAVANVDSVQAPNHVRGGGANPPKIPEAQEDARIAEIK